jgi:hypothetical protein
MGPVKTLAKSYEIKDTRMGLMNRVWTDRIIQCSGGVTIKRNETSFVGGVNVNLTIDRISGAAKEIADHTDQIETSTPQATIHIVSANSRKPL